MLKEDGVTFTATEQANFWLKHFLKSLRQLVANMKLAAWSVHAIWNQERHGFMLSSKKKSE
jgi:hypothetical protein